MDRQTYKQTERQTIKLLQTFQTGGIKVNLSIHFGVVFNEESNAFLSIKALLDITFQFFKPLCFDRDH